MVLHLGVRQDSPAEAATPIDTDATRRLLMRTKAVLMGIMATECDDPIQELRRGIIDRLHSDIANALAGR